MKVAIGIEKNHCKEIVDLINHVLADTYVLYVKTQNYHWNIVDTRFSDLHKFLEGQYEALAEAVDTVAERARMLGGRAIGSLHEFLEKTSLKESSQLLSGDEMLKDLLQDHETICNNLRKGIVFSQERGDEGTADLFIQLLRDHEKTAWMIRAHFV